MADKLRTEIGSRLKKIRSATDGGIGSSISRFAALIGETPYNIANYEQGKANVPPRVLIGIYELGYDPVWVLTGDGDMEYRRGDSSDDEDDIINDPELVNVINEFEVAAGKLKDALKKKD